MNSLIFDLFQNKDSNIAKDLQLNFKRYTEHSSLSEAQVMLLVYSLTKDFHQSALATYAKERLNSIGFTHAQIDEASEISAFIKMLNTYYKFKHFINNDNDYKQADLRMNAMAKSSLKKIDFEMLAFAYSLLNGCEFCVKAHEHELRQLGLSADQIHDVVRLTSILSAMKSQTVKSIDF